MATRTIRLLEWWSCQPGWSKVAFAAAGGVVAAGFCALAAPAIGAAVSAAGFGVAGGTLSGAAASSAGLAALGGGSIAAGGFGVAGGTTVIATVGGVGSAVGISVASAKAAGQGERFADLGRRARETNVADGGIRFE